MPNAAITLSLTGPATIGAGVPSADYVLTIQNVGPDDAINVSLQTGVNSPAPIIPSVSQLSGPPATINGLNESIADLPAGSSASFSIAVQIFTGPADGNYVKPGPS